MKISIITATWQAGDMIDRVGDEVRRQTYKDCEWLVSDGGSDDQTLEKLTRNADVVAWWQSGPDAGILDAWNKAIVQAAGDWLYFLGADDRFANDDTLEKAAVRLAELPPSCLIAYGDVDMVRSDGSLVETLGGPWDPRGFREVCMNLPHQGTFHRRALFEQHGLFDTAGGSTGTYEMLMRHLKDHDAIYLSGLKVGLMQVGGVSSDPANQRRFYRAYVAAQKKHGTYRPNAKLAFRLMQGLVKERVYRLVGRERTRRLVDFSRRLVGKRPHGG